MGRYITVDWKYTIYILKPGFGNETLYHVCLKERITTHVSVLRKTVALCILKAFTRMYVKDI